MLLRAAEFIEAASRWRLASAAVLLVIVGMIAQHHPHRPLRIGAPPAMIRTSVAEEIARAFTRDTGIPAEVVPARSMALVLTGGAGVLDVAFDHGARMMKLFRTHTTRTHNVIVSDFVLIGPRDDPADVWTAHSARDAFWRIWSSHAAFRPAPEGTAAASVEKKLWRDSGLPGPLSRPGDSMTSAFTAAMESHAYMLIDRLTYEHLYAGRDLMVLFAGDPALRDEYVVAEVNGSHPVRRAADLFCEWLESRRGRNAILTASRQ